MAQGRTGKRRVKRVGCGETRTAPVAALRRRDVRVDGRVARRRLHHRLLNEHRKALHRDRRGRLPGLGAAGIRRRSTRRVRGQVRGMELGRRRARSFGRAETFGRRLVRPSRRTGRRREAVLSVGVRLARQAGAAQATRHTLALLLIVGFTVHGERLRRELHRRDRVCVVLGRDGAWGRRRRARRNDLRCGGGRKRLERHRRGHRRRAVKRARGNCRRRTQGGRQRRTRVQRLQCHRFVLGQRRGKRRTHGRGRRRRERRHLGLHGPRLPRLPRADVRLRRLRHRTLRSIVLGAVGKRLGLESRRRRGVRSGEGGSRCQGGCGRNGGCGGRRGRRRRRRGLGLCCWGLRRRGRRGLRSLRGLRGLRGLRSLRSLRGPRRRSLGRRSLRLSCRALRLQSRAKGLRARLRRGRCLGRRLCRRTRLWCRRRLRSRGRLLLRGWRRRTRRCRAGRLAHRTVLCARRARRRIDLGHRRCRLLLLAAEERSEALFPLAAERAFRLGRRRRHRRPRVRLLWFGKGARHFVLVTTRRERRAGRHRGGRRHALAEIRRLVRRRARCRARCRALRRGLRRGLCRARRRARRRVRRHALRRGLRRAWCLLYRRLRGRRTVCLHGRCAVRLCCGCERCMRHGCMDRRRARRHRQAPVGHGRLRAEALQRWILGRLVVRHRRECHL